jgi:hypothetical protein
MLKRQVVLIAVVLANSSIGFTQTLGDFAREERARRNSFAPAASTNVAARPTIPAAKPDVPVVKPVVPAAKPVAPVVKPKVPDLIIEAVRVSGARRQLLETTETFRPSLAREGNEVSAQEYQKIINEALAPEHLTQLLERSVFETVKDNTLTNVLRWYGSPLGRKIATVETNSYAPDTAARFQRFAARAQEKAPSASRLELIEGIGAAGLGVPRTPVDVDNDAWLLFVYDSLSGSELADYLSFLNSPSATAFNSAVWNGIDAVFGEAAQEFQQKLADTKSNGSTR